MILVYTQGTIVIRQGWIQAILLSLYSFSPPPTTGYAPAIPALFDGQAEARLIALACSEPSEGRRRWTLQLLSERVVELNIVPHCTANTVHEVLKKTRLNRISRNTG